MVRLYNVSVEQFHKNVENKKIVLWGAGKLASFYIRTFCANQNIIYIVDKNKNLCGKSITVNDKDYRIISEENFIAFLESDNNLREEVVIFVTPIAYALEIIKHMNEIPVLDNVDCYAGILLREFYKGSKVVFTIGEPKIPKKIHYCWFGGKDIPEHLKRYMDSWNRFCPDYEIIRWDETNYDISKNRYMREAYMCHKWGFVPDYARLDIIYNEGGIYLDTDVELVSSLDRLRNDEMFCGFGCNYMITFGCGFGAQKGHPLIKKLRDAYEDERFCLEHGKLNLKTCYEYQHPVLINFGFTLENHYQKKKGVVIYPSDVLISNFGSYSEKITENTVSIHRSEYSWASEEERKAYELCEKELEYLVNV